MSNAELMTEEQMAESGTQLMLVSDPEKQVLAATKACTVLMKIVEAKHLYEEFGRGKDRKRHLKVEAWLLLGHFFGVTTRTESVISVQDDATGHFGFEATIEALDGRGQVRGRAIARCMSNEENWGMVAKYEWKGETREEVGQRQKAMAQLSSMAQTRATGRVLSSLFRWVVILGVPNVSGTPAEEMGRTQRKPEATTEQPANRITDAQRKRIFGVAHGVGMPIENLPTIMHKHGFEQAHEVTKDRYDAVVAEIQNWKVGQ
jgi:hypothetical protein